MKIRLLSFLFLVMLSTVSFAQRASYSIRLFNCDDSCTAEVGGGVVSSVEFGRDSGWIDFTDTLQDGKTLIKLSVYNEAGGIAYGLQIRRNQTVIFEKICGRAGAVGCENNRTFPKGVAREFSYPLQIAPDERPVAYARWINFLPAFRVAVSKRDRVALRGMIAIPFETQDPGEIHSFDAVMKWFKGGMWGVLQQEIAPGARFYSSLRDGKAQRCAQNGIFCFEYGRDGKWRLADQTEGDID